MEQNSCNGVFEARRQKGQGRRVKSKLPLSSVSVLAYLFCDPKRRRIIMAVAEKDSKT